MYFVIYQTDTDASVIPYEDKKSLLSDINVGNYEDLGFLKELPDSASPAEWGPNAIVIKGEIVVPKEKTVVKEYDIE